VPAFTVRVSFNIDRTAAILAGKSTFGKEHAYVDPASLTETQRAALAGCEFKQEAFVLAGYQTTIASAHDVNVPALLDEIAEHWRKVDARERETRRYHYSDAVDAAVKWLEEPGDRHVGETRFQYNSPPRITVTEFHHSYLQSLKNYQAEFQDPRAEEFLASMSS
jgi:hypothetical protein